MLSAPRRVPERVGASQSCHPAACARRRRLQLPTRPRPLRTTARRSTHPSLPTTLLVSSSRFSFTSHSFSPSPSLRPSRPARFSRRSSSRPRLLHARARCVYFPLFNLYQRQPPAQRRRRTQVRVSVLIDPSLRTSACLLLLSVRVRASLQRLSRTSRVAVAQTPPAPCASGRARLCCAPPPLPASAPPPCQRRATRCRHTLRRPSTLRDRVGASSMRQVCATMSLSASSRRRASAGVTRCRSRRPGACMASAPPASPVGTLPARRRR
jgi:hypothetical protein